MIRRAVFAACMVVALASAGEARAHGTGWRLTDERAVTVELYYADGDEMPFADVRVFSPADAAVPVLHGRADARGRVAFVPDRDGTWILAASDGDGHAVNAAIPVTLGAPIVSVPRAPMELRLMLAGSVLANVGLALLAWVLLARRAATRVAPAA